MAMFMVFAIKKNKTNINKKYLKYILKRNQMKKYKLNEHSLSEVYNWYID